MLRLVMILNRNVESHFSLLPQNDIHRSIFDRSSGHKTSFDVGELIPLYLDEILPGDSVDITTSKVVRLQTLLTPIMDNLYFDTYWFFVPNRIIWDHWKEFCGENTQSAWAPTTEYAIPTIKSPANGFAPGTIADYFGLPVNKAWSSGPHMPSALPFRAYAKICDEFFRDENLSDPLNIPLGDAIQQGSNGDNYISDVANGGKPFKVAKYHDYFTSCLPAPQKGDSPVINFSSDFKGGDFPVFTADKLIDRRSFYDLAAGSPSLKQARFWEGVYDSSGFVSWSGSSDNVDKRAFAGGQDHGAQGVYLTDGNSNSILSLPSQSSFNRKFFPANFFARLPDQEIGGAGLNINELRLAFQTQRFLERNARGGTRYVEILKSHFGVTSPDARLQRPEYLGGNRFPLNVHSVSNTAQGEKDFLGDLGANSVTSDVHADVKKSFTEHGFLICVGCVRYDHTYSQGLERFWFRKSFTDFYLPVFANIGEQPVFTDEIFFENSEDVFGYQEAWADYRYKPSRVSSEMRPNVSNSLAYWHLADNYSKAPILSDSWIREDKSIVDRVLAVQSSNANQVFCDIYFKGIYTRPMPMYSIPGLIDHN